MARPPVMAAGGIVVRAGPRPLIAIVQRRKDSHWVLPKGKLKAGEKAVAAARREVIEETGQDVKVHDFLGALTYDRGRKSKVVQFWRMEPTGHSGRRLTRDIKAVRWLSLKAAVAALDDPLEQVFLRHIGQRAVALSRMLPAPEKPRMDVETAAPEEPPPSAVPQVLVSNVPEVRPNLLQRALQLFTRMAQPGSPSAPNS